MIGVERACAVLLAEDGRRRAGESPQSDLDVPLAILRDLADDLPMDVSVAPDATAGAVVLAHLAAGGTVVMR